MRPLKTFCLSKLKSIFGHHFDARISYERMDKILGELDIKWEWPMHRPKKGENPTERPRYRMIDAIKEDLKWGGIDLKTSDKELR